MQSDAARQVYVDPSEPAGQSASVCGCLRPVEVRITMSGDLEYGMNIRKSVFKDAGRHSDCVDQMLGA